MPVGSKLLYKKLTKHVDPAAVVQGLLVVVCPVVSNRVPASVCTRSARMPAPPPPHADCTVGQVGDVVVEQRGPHCVPNVDTSGTRVLCSSLVHNRVADRVVCVQQRAKRIVERTNLHPGARDVVEVATIDGRFYRPAKVKANPTKPSKLAFAF